MNDLRIKEEAGRGVWEMRPNVFTSPHVRVASFIPYLLSLIFHPSSLISLRQQQHAGRFQVANDFIEEAAGRRAVNQTMVE